MLMDGFIAELVVCALWRVGGRGRFQVCLIFISNLYVACCGGIYCIVFTVTAALADG